MILDIDGEEMEVRLTLDAKGRLRSVQTERWGNATDEKAFALIPFGGDIEEERQFGNMTIPTKMTVGWWYGTERYSPFFRATIQNTEFK